MSSSESFEVGLSKCETAVLVFIANRVGWVLDHLEVVHDANVRVVEVVQAVIDEHGYSPADSRRAIQSLLSHGFVGRFAFAGGEVLDPRAEVYLTSRGLDVARECGSDPRVSHVIYLTPKANSVGPVPDCRIDSGNKERDGELNRSGVALAVFYLIMLRTPTRARPLRPSELHDEMLRLAVVGIGPRRGPGVRLVASDDAIGKALDVLAGIIPSLSKRSVADDRRKCEWFVDGALPEVRMTDGRRWSDVLRAVSNELRGDQGAGR